MFDGATYDRDRDGKRLTGQLEAVAHILATHEWVELPELVAKVRMCVGGHVTDSGVTARVRDLRKEKFGGHVIYSRAARFGGGVWEYRMAQDVTAQQRNMR